MSKALTLFDQPGMAIPAHLRDLNDEGNIEDRVSVPTLSYEGKVWTIALNGEKTKLMKRDADGDEMPMPVMRVVVLDYNQRRGRSYYEGAYDPSKPAQPLCWSEDGVTPHSAVTEPQCKSCDKCPMAVKGSKVTEQGKAVQACSQHRMLAIVPANKLDMEPLRLKLAVTSDYDKENELEAQGWYAFSAYKDFLKARGINHTALLVTKMRFDPNVAYPKVLFSPDRWVEPEEKAVVNPKVKSDAVKKLLTGFTPAGSNGTPIAADDEDDAPPPPKKLSEQAKAKAKPKPMPVDDDEDDAPPPPKKAKAKPVLDDDEDDAPPPPKKAKPAPVADDEDDIVIPSKAEKPKAKPQVLDDDEEIPVQPKKVAAAAAPTSGSLPDDVASLLDDWGDD